MVCELCGTGTHFLNSKCLTNCLKLADGSDVTRDFNGEASGECDCASVTSATCCK
jgi:hypothetical protein